MQFGWIGEGGRKRKRRIEIVQYSKAFSDANGESLILWKFPLDTVCIRAVQNPQAEILCEENPPAKGPEYH